MKSFYFLKLRVNKSAHQLSRLMLPLFFVLLSTLAYAQPANDNPCNATPLAVGAVCNYTTATNVNATATAGVPAPGCGNYSSFDVWFSVVVPAGGAISFDSNTGTMTDGAMAIYSGTCGNLNLLACDDDASANGLMPSVAVSGQTPGTTLYVRFWSYGPGVGNTGTFSICATSPPANDDPCGATPLTASTTGCNYSTYSTANATNTLNVPAPGCANYLGNDVWFSVTVPSTGSVTFDTQTGAITDGGMAVYSGTSCSALTLLGCNDDGSANGLMPSMTVSNRPPGSTLWVRFWPYGNAVNGTFGICATVSTPLPPTNQDCPNAIPICQNVYSTTASYSLEGNIQDEIDPLNSCLGAGEYNDVWYTFTVQNSGNLNFTITPNNFTEDYDWAVFNLTNATCADIATNPALSVSCNFSATGGNTGPTGGSALNSQGAAGTPFNAVVPVTAGQTYVVNVSNFSASQNGYTINFGASTATIFDNIPPQLTSINSNIPCGATQISFQFSENILCNTIQNADFTLTGPGGPYTLSGWTSPGCAAGGLYDRFVTVNVSPAITTAGTYQLCLVNGSGSVTDLCGNVAPPGCMSFTINPILITTSQTNIQCLGTNSGSISVSPTSGVDPYTYVWTPNVGNTATVSNLAAGTYSVTITDANGCHASQSVTITAPTSSVTGSITPTQPTCGASNGSATVAASGGTGPYTYAWSPSGGTGATASGLGGGNYTVTITDSHGCTVSLNTTLAAPSAPTALINSITNCTCALPTGSLGVGVTGGTGPFTYSWTPSGGSNATATGLQPGSYSVVVTDAVGCSSSATATITGQPVINANILSTTNPGCNGATNGAVTATGANGIPTYTYDWTPGGATTATVSNLGAGVYTVTVTDAQGCTASATATLSAPPPVTVSASNTPVTCNGSATGSATALGSGTGTLTYNWTPTGGNNATANNLTAGTYTVVVTDMNGCSATTSTVVTQPPVLTISTNAIASICGQNSGSATAVVAGGTPNYQYNWAPTGQSGDTASNLPSGSYTVTVTDNNGCTASSTVNVATLPGPTATMASFNNVSCFGGSNGSANATVSGGSGPYTYAWSPSGGTAANATNLSAGAYTVTITDANGCTSTAAALITEPTQLTASISASSNVLCAGAGNGSATVTAGGGTTNYSYSWTPSGGTGTTASNLTGGTYTATITDANGCTVTATTTITEPQPLTAGTTTTPALCSGVSNGSATVNTSGGTNPVTYSWSPSGGTGATASNLAAGSYTVTVTDANGCTNSATAIVTQPVAMTASLSASTNVTCFGANDGSATVSSAGGTAPFTYAWTPSGGTNASATGLAAGSYSVTITDANGCTATTTATITEPTAVVATLTTSANVTCNGQTNGSATINVNGGSPAYTYSWAPSGGNGATAGSLGAGSYTVTATDAAGCTSTVAVIITEPPLLTVTLSSTSNVICNGGTTGSATITAGGGTAAYTYAWTPTGGNGTTASGLSAGSYSALVTDANGCTATVNATITEPAPVTASTTTTPVICNGGSTGSATVAPSGGTTPFTYAWSPSGGTGATANGLAAGTYTVTATDANGCSATTTAVITEPAPMTASLSSSTNVSCFGGNNGQATVTAGGGTAPFTYAWSPSGGTSATAGGLTAGSYSVTITDANGCSASTTATITQPTALTSSLASSANVTCNGLTNGSASVSANGGTPAYTYSWTPSGGTSASAVNLGAGSYTVTATDAAGCSSTVAVTITEPAPLTLALTSSTNVSCNGGANGSASITAGGGTTAYTYQWNPSGGTTTSASGLTAGVYTATVTDANGCTTTTTATITEPTILSGSITPTSSTCGNSNGSASAIANGGTATYTYAWQPSGGTGATASNLAAGNYSVTITDANGCTVSYSTTVTNLAPALINTTLVSDVLCNGGNTGSTSASVITGNGPYTYSWSPSGGNAATATNLTAGNYTVTVTDANGCTTTGAVTVSQPSALTAAGTSTPVSCFGGNDGAASVNSNGGTPGYSYQWTPGNYTVFNPANLTAGTYQVTVTDQNGCTTTASATITQPNALNASVTPTAAHCFGSADGSATVSASGGTPAYTYNWFPGGSTSATANALTSGTYTVTVSDANGCTFTATANVTQPASLSLSTTSTAATCGSANGTATVNASGGAGSYTYSWSPSGGTNSTANNLAAGTYSVQVTDANGCTSTATESVSNTGGPVITASVQTQVSCNGGNNGAATVAVSSGSSPFTYQWSPAGGTGANATNLTAGTYSITVTDVNGCVSTDNITITEPTALALQTGGTNVSCAGGNDGSASVQVAGGTSPYTYAWSPGGASTSQVNTLSAGTYSVIVTDQHGCSQSASQQITQPASIVVNSITSTQTGCSGAASGTATVSAAGGAGSLTYAWTPFGGTNTTATALSAGTYTATITDANGCTVTATVNVTQPTSFTLTPSSTSSSCGAANGTASVQVNGGAGPFTFSWSPIGGNTNTASNLNAGAYTVTVTDANGCSSASVINVLNQGGPTATASVTTPISCFGSNNGQASANVTGGTGPFTYAWSPSGGSSATATNLGAGNYSVLITDANGCTVTSNVTLIQPASMTAQASSTPVACHGGNNGSVSVVIGGGNPNYTYNWQPGNSSLAAPTGLTAGTYIVTATDASGCTISASTTIIEPAALSVQATPVDVTCNGLSNGSVTTTVSGGTSGYLYSWFPSGGSAQNASNLSAGTYTVTVTDANNCTTSASTVISQPAALHLTTATNPASCGSANGSANVSTGGGAGTFSFSWSPGGSTLSSVTNLSAGTYIVTVTDGNGCSATASANVSNIGGPVINASVNNNVSCAGGSNGSATVNVSSGTAPYTYQWSPSGGTSATATNLAAGIYSVSVADANGCLSAASVTITVPPALAVQASSTNATCAGYSNGNASSTVAGGTSPYNYLWNPGGATSSTANNLSAGSYTVTVTDANGCTLSAAASISQPAALNASISSTPATCSGSATGSATVTVNGGSGNLNYQWSPTGGTSTAAQNLLPGNYSVTITDANGCTTSLSTTVGQGVTVSINVTNTPSSCGSSNGTASASVSGGNGPYTYTWSPSGGSAANATNLAAGIYIVTATDANGCSATSSTQIINTGGPTLSVASTTDASCAGGSNGSATISANGGTLPYTYQWSPIGGSNATANGLSAGAYSVVVADANNCQSVINVTINEPAAIALTGASTPAACTASNGSATVTASGGAGGYTYNWTGLSGITTSTASNLSSGNYTVVVTDVNGCSQSALINVGTAGGATAMLQNSNDVSCNGGNNGSAAISVSGGTAPYTYNWIPSGGNAATASGLTADTYTVNVTDANGCTSSVIVVIDEPSAIALSTSSTPASCNGGTDGSVSVIASGGQSPYTYQWQGLTSTSATVSNLGIGNYNVTVIDANGCAEISMATVNSATPLAMNATVNSINCNGGGNGSATLNPSGGTPPYTYAWTPSVSTNSSASNLSGGAYSVLVTDQNGCATIYNFTIVEPDPILLTVSPAVQLCIGQSTQIDATVTGGTAPYTYNWSNGPTTASQSVNPATATIYSVTVTDANNCAGGTQSVNVGINPPLSVNANAPVVICSGENANLSAVAAGGDGNYTYTWSNGIIGAGQTVNPQTSTNYTVTVTDGCGTPATQAYTNVQVGITPDAEFGPYIMQGCSPVTVHFSNHSVAPAGSTYSWNFGNSSTSDEESPTFTYTEPGIYTVQLAVTSPEGCSDSQTNINMVEVYEGTTASFIPSATEVDITTPQIDFYNSSINGTTYTWDFGDGSPLNQEQSPSHEYADTGYYAVSLISMSPNGCLDTTTQYIKIDQAFTIYIPNAFTPNFDDVNDSFNAYGIGWKDYEMFILDRWGLNIFHSTDSAKPWDGHYEGSGDPCQADVYVYKIKVHDTKGVLHSFIGHVTLVR